MTTETGTKCKWCDSTDTADYTVLGPKHVALCQKHTCSGCCPILVKRKGKRECLRSMTDKEFRFTQWKLRELRHLTPNGRTRRRDREKGQWKSQSKPSMVHLSWKALRLGPPA